jgi:putative restriction endonuclease
VRYERTFGDIAGYPEGSCFGTRLELSQAGLHRPMVAGISGSGRIGANSVVLAGGYEDTEDFGDEILYTGHGGRDPETGCQVTHQTLTRGNLALACNKLYGLPVRVIRGARQRSPYAPAAGYRYDGLYSVDEYWREVGKAGFYIWRFQLVKIAVNGPR